MCSCGQSSALTCDPDDHFPAGHSDPGRASLLSTDQGRPYEYWDEIATYNNAHVLVRPASDRTFRYGSIDTFLQWIGIVGYDYLSYIGATHGHLRYSNHVPASWSDPYISFGEQTWGQPDYNYFRGTDDRNPILFRDDCIWHSLIV